MDINGLLALPESWERLKNCGRVLIYGTGNACERILDRFGVCGTECAGIFASDGFVRDRSFRGYRVLSLSEAEERFGEFTVCCAFGSQLPEVMAQIDRLSERHEVIFPDLPIAGEEFFSREGLAARRERLEEAAALFADDMSLRVLECLLSFKMTGDLRFLRRAFTDSTAADFARLIQPRAGDVYADLGAYNGDTAEQFAELCPEYGHICAFEPDKRSFRKCVKRLMGHDRITAVNACAWSCDRILGFSQSAGRQSQITGQGSPVGSPTAARALDSVLAGGRCDVIKLDVEGAEREALAGADETIRRFSPRLAVSAYHRPYDLIDLPLQLKALNGGYRLYLRQPPYYPAWDSCIYAIGEDDVENHSDFSQND